jgi:hypothetical protein
MNTTKRTKKEIGSWGNIQKEKENRFLLSFLSHPNLSYFSLPFLANVWGPIRFLLCYFCTVACLSLSSIFFRTGLSSHESILHSLLSQNYSFRVTVALQIAWDVWIPTYLSHLAWYLNRFTVTIEICKLNLRKCLANLEVRILCTWFIIFLVVFSGNQPYDS